MVSTYKGVLKQVFSHIAVLVSGWVSTHPSFKNNSMKVSQTAIKQALEILKSIKKP
jgi:hypothetical protein